MASASVNVTVKIEQLAAFEKLIRHAEKWASALDDIDGNNPEVLGSHGICWARGYVAGLKHSINAIANQLREKEPKLSACKPV